MSRPEDRDTQFLEQAFSTDGLSRAAGGCPSEDELWASAAGELDPAGDEALILHLARCGECSSIWRLAREILPEDHLSEPSVVSMDQGRQWKTWRRMLLPAAALIVLGVGLSAGLYLRSESPSAPVFREQIDDVVILPAPHSDRLRRAACHLRWTRGPAGTRYDLVVTDDELTILADVKGLNKPKYTLPREQIPTSATELLWRVTAHLPDGRTVASDTFTTVIIGP